MIRWKPAAATLALALVLATTLNAQDIGFTRMVIEKRDLSVAGREVVQSVVEIPAGMIAGRHTHAGEEVGYVLEGTLTLVVDGKPPKTVKAGESYFVPPGAIHDGMAESVVKLLATHIVEKSKPLATPVQ